MGNIESGLGFEKHLIFSVTLPENTNVFMKAIGIQLMQHRLENDAA